LFDFSTKGMDELCISKKEEEFKTDITWFLSEQFVVEYV
jgi:hypothetical protein